MTLRHIWRTWLDRTRTRRRLRLVISILALPIAIPVQVIQDFWPDLAMMPGQIREEWRR